MMTTLIEKIGKFTTICREKGQQVIKTIYLDHLPVAHFNIEILFERRVAAVELIERGLCNNKIAGELCGFHRNTILNLLRTKNILGLDAICVDGRGHKQPYKYINETQTCIKKLLEINPEWSDQQIADRAAGDLGIEIARSAVARIRTKKQKPAAEGPVKNELLEISLQVERIVKERTEQLQLWLNFETEPELKAKAEECALEPVPKAVSEIQQELIKELQQGKLTAFAGGFMHHLFLHEIGFVDLVGAYTRNPGATYQGIDILSTIFHSITQGIESIEALKLVNSSDLGLLIGRSRIPDKDTMRDHLGQMAQKYICGDLIERFALRLLEQERIDREVFFIDGHFLPYYGMTVIAKGYFTVRRLAMRGNELYAITDLQGRPLFFITESNEIDFRPIISRSAVMLEKFGIHRPILVFDRGGYGIHFFSKLDETADFVTWAKHLTEKSLADVPDESFSIGVFAGENHFLVAQETRVVSESAQTAKKDGRQTPTTIELRLVILKDADTGKRLGIFTNNMTKPAYEIAWYQLQRWGKSENVYKELMAKFNLNYHPGYDIKELESQPLVDNPDIGLIKKAIQSIKREMVALEKEIVYTEALFDRERGNKLKDKLLKLRIKLAEDKNETLEFENKLKTLPDKVSVMELLSGRPMCRCDLEKKKLYDLMQFVAYHSRERLVEIFRECYDDQRDIKRVLDMITTKGGVIKLIGQTLMVILSGIENRKHRMAAKRLCDKLNEKNIVMTSGVSFKLSFHIANIP